MAPALPYSKTRVDDLIVEVSRKMGKSVRPGGWYSRRLREADHPSYTGPPLDIWILALIDDVGQVGSIGFTAEELEGCAGEHRETVEARVRQALAKVP